MFRFKTMFDTLEFKKTPVGIQAKKQYGKYLLSVVQITGQTLYEAAIFDKDNFVQLPGIHLSDWDDDVIPHLSPDKVSAIMKKMELIKLAEEEKENCNVV